MPGLFAVMKLFMLSMRVRSPAVLEYVSLPCLRILQHIIKPESAGSKKFKVSDKSCYAVSKE